MRVCEHMLLLGRKSNSFNNRFEHSNTILFSLSLHSIVRSARFKLQFRSFNAQRRLSIALKNSRAHFFSFYLPSIRNRVAATNCLQCVAFRALFMKMFAGFSLIAWNYYSALAKTFNYELAVKSELKAKSHKHTHTFNFGFP